MNKWDICWAKVPFEDIQGEKIRPVIILSNSTAVVVDCLKMTSQSPRPGEYVLQKWREAGLPKPTTVRISKRLLLDSTRILDTIGSLQPIDIFEISKLLSA